MTKNITSTPTTELQIPEEVRRRWAREAAAPQLTYIGQLAVSIRCAMDDIATLERMSEGREDAVNPYSDGGDGTTWPELLYDLRGLEYSLYIAESFLKSQFTRTVSDALYRADLLNDDGEVVEDEAEDEDDAGDDADAPNLLPAKGSMEMNSTLKEAELLDDDDAPDAESGAPEDDAPADPNVQITCTLDSELPPAKTRPYWLG